jgi:hypothetical protein
LLGPTPPPPPSSPCPPPPLPVARTMRQALPMCLSLLQCVYAWSQRPSPSRRAAYAALVQAEVHLGLADMGLAAPSQLAALIGLIGDDMPADKHFTGLGIVSAVAEVASLVRAWAAGFLHTHKPPAPRAHARPPPPTHTHNCDLCRVGSIPKRRWLHTLSAWCSTSLPNEPRARQPKSTPCSQATPQPLFAPG